jgi:asparagine synthase (glutamine-hydrolysing)
MSGICGVVNFDGEPLEASDIFVMTSLLQRRGPERTGVWRDGSVGLGHTLLATTPEAEEEQLPLVHEPTGCAITADVRLDNREELLRLLRRGDEKDLGDAAIVLAAYLEWGETCTERLLGDFAFAIWDPRQRQFFGARDHMGMKPFYYHHSPRKVFAVTSEPKAILALPRTPYRINEGRIADYLVNPLEGIDKTSTFFEEVYRLPPAHTLTVDREGMRLRKYWHLEPGDELRLSDDQSYSEAFLEVFTKAIRSRLRSVGPIGSMLSGGIDSSSVTAIASAILADAGQGPLPTFSAVSPNADDCIETRTIHATVEHLGESIEPHLISHDDLARFPTLPALMRMLDEPFDGSMALPRVIYLAARLRGCRVVLDGVAGDVVLGASGYLTHLLRTGRWGRAYSEASKSNAYWGGGDPPIRQLATRIFALYAPRFAKRLRRRAQARPQAAAIGREAGLRTGFAEQVRLHERLATLRAQGASRPGEPFAHGRARSITHPFLTVGRERYDRVAASVGVEPRDPFLDVRLIELAVRLPGEQLLENGYPKAVLRHALAAHLPDEVRFRRGKEHLGWVFTTAAAALDAPAPSLVDDAAPMVSRYVDLDAASREGGNLPTDLMYNLAQLEYWLRRHQRRPGGCEAIPTGRRP